MVILRNIFFFFLHSELFLNQQIERKLINTNKIKGKRKKKERKNAEYLCREWKIFKILFRNEWIFSFHSSRISMIKNYREKRGKKKRKALIPSRLGFLFKIPLAFAIEEINKRNIEAAL